MWDPAKLAPALVLNATIVSTGERIVISPFQIDAPYKLSHFPVGGAPEAGQSTGGISLSTAIALSARFPWVTPAGTIEGDPIIFGGKREPQADDRNSDTVVPASAKRPRLQLVDGGYADNSGVHTALDIIDGLKAVQADPSFPEKFEVHLLVLRVEDVKKDPVLVSDYLAPIATLLSIREAQSRDAIGRAQRLFGDKASKIASSAKLFEFIHANTAYTLPLGWQISDLTNSIIASSLGHPKQCSSDPSLNQSGPGCMLTKIMATLALQEVKTALAPSVVAKPPVSAGNPLSKERLISCLASSTELFRGSVTAQQADGIAEIVKAWTDQNRTKDSRQLAYVLATAYFETARTMVPIREYGAYRSTTYLNKANEKNYYGRGYIQLVWASNYKKVGDAIKVDLYNNPDLMLEKTISAQALVASMAEGLLTGRKLSDFFAEDADWIGARKIVNGLNRADLIGSFAQQFNACLSGAGATLAYDN